MLNIDALLVRIVLGRNRMEWLEADGETDPRQAKEMCCRPQPTLYPIAPPLYLPLYPVPLPTPLLTPLSFPSLLCTCYQVPYFASPLHLPLLLFYPPFMFVSTSLYEPDKDRDEERWAPSSTLIVFRLLMRPLSTLRLMSLQMDTRNMGVPVITILADWSSSWSSAWSSSWWSSWSSSWSSSLWWWWHWHSLCVSYSEVLVSWVVLHHLSWFQMQAKLLGAEWKWEISVESASLFLLWSSFLPHPLHCELSNGNREFQIF